MSSVRSFVDDATSLALGADPVGLPEHTLPTSLAADAERWDSNRFYDVEELLTKVEHHAALAQIALEDLQTKLASVRAAGESTTLAEPLPDNVIRFPGR